MPAGVYAPRPSRQESKADSTTNVARSIIEAEAKARDAKTAKLRALRLAQEAVSEPVAPAKRPARKAAAK
ncbi:hypothetical protein KEU06_20400 [Pseudaminobacter sp. 19-2017]|uniref:Uncharacterized protein n=1 Tax=Pseudaminobacter soli (ex Zhang et al. 2022) TaxID=2831468 RepID=A0A942E4F5_9HYPH|nr:hypothetical protein [Pseudaminobacter soli]